MWTRTRPLNSRYGNIRNEYNGRVYHSKKEANYAAELDLLKKAGQIADWKPQVRIPLDVNGFHICNYYIDFEVSHNDETTEYVEVKGFQTDVWRMKWKLLEALYDEKVKSGEVKLTVVY